VLCGVRLRGVDHGLHPPQPFPVHGLIPVSPFLQEFMQCDKAVGLSLAALARRAWGPRTSSKMGEQTKLFFRPRSPIIY